MTTRNDSTKMWRVSYVVDCQAEIVECDKFEVTTASLPFGCIVINKYHWEKEHSGTQKFWNFVIWRCMSSAKLIFVSPYLQFCLWFEDAMTVLLRCHHRNQRNRMVSVWVKLPFLVLFLLLNGSCLGSNKLWFHLQLGR